MLNIKELSYIATGIKAETIKKLEQIGYYVSKIYFFAINDLENNSNKIISEFKVEKLAIAASNKVKEIENFSSVSAYNNLAYVFCENKLIEYAKKKEITSFYRDIANQVLAQPMIGIVAIGGGKLSCFLDNGLNIK